MPDVTYEIKFKTARSGGKGGQNVNKVETMVEGYWHINKSQLFDELQKERLTGKLANRTNAGGFLLVKSQEDRSQLGNRENVIKKINALIRAALVIPKKRKPTKIPARVKEERLTGKKFTGEKKSGRKKVVL